ncbi:MAG: hypothetical protein VX805_02930 [Pseudomonadota bacterium]|nr:hypothetical protein [Pseudomonadota bacterium]
MKLTNRKLKKLFGNLEKNAGVVVDHQLDLIDDRLDELEKKEQWRDLMALVQEYKEWCDDDLDFEMIWMDRIKTITSD